MDCRAMPSGSDAPRLGIPLLTLCIQPCLWAMQACSQPAIFVSSCAAVEKLKAEMGEEAAMSATVRPL